MNQHFGGWGKMSWSGYPRHAFSRVDYVEAEQGGEQLEIGFDAVGTDSAGAVISVESPDEHWRRAWARAFEEGGAAVLNLLPFRHLRLYHVTVRLPPDRADAFLADSGGREGEGWRNLVLSAEPVQGSERAEVFGGLNAAPIPVYILPPSRTEPDMSAALSAAFSMRHWPRTSIDVAAAHLHLARITADRLRAFSVGQGSANALVDASNSVTLFHDLGCGAYRNAFTTPNHLAICHSGGAPVLLSHWDTDHWAGATRFAPPFDPNAFLRRDWVAPYDLTIGARHAAFAASILAAGGSLRIVTPGWKQHGPIATFDGREITLIEGTGRDRNGTGIALQIEDRASSSRWLLTADVPYEHLQHVTRARTYTAVTAPHHGADVKNPAALVSPSRGYSRLIYSFGGGNSYGHPTSRARAEHDAVGWTHASWVPGAAVGTSVSVRGTGGSSAHTAPLPAIDIGWGGPPPPRPPICSAVKGSIGIPSSSACAVGTPQR